MRDLAEEQQQQEVEKRDRIRPWPVCALHAALGLPGEPPRPGEPLPPLWRWLYFLDAPRRSALGSDGSAIGQSAGGIFGGGAFHWVSGRLAFRRPLVVGRTAQCVVSPDRRQRAETEDGPVEVLTQRMDVTTTDGSAEVEERDYVRRVGGLGSGERPMDSPPLMSKPVGSAARLPKARWRRRWALDAPLLFRYAALTFDANRLHYDLDYCRETAGLTGLQVPTPLLATLLLDLARENGPDMRISRFSYRLREVLTHNAAFETCCRPTKLDDGGEGADLWIETESAPRRVIMTATIAYAS